MDKYAIDRLIDDLTKARDAGIITSGAFNFPHAELLIESNKRAPYTEALEIQRDVEEVQTQFSDLMVSLAVDSSEAEGDVNASLSGLWTRLETLKGILDVDS